jgi:hypothetical protein
MPRVSRTRLLFAVLILLVMAVPAMGDEDARRFQTKLIGFQEVPAVSTVATGEFSLKIGHDEQSIQWALAYRDLQADATQAHIHFGQRSVNGGIVIWLCQTSSTAANNPGPVAHTCGARSDSFEGTATAANVVAIGGANAGQQIAAGDLADVIAAIRAGVAYANVHTSASTGGEIRGQIRRGDGGGGDGGNQE